LQTSISAVERKETGKGKCGRMRVAGKVPAVAYGQGKDPMNLELDGHAMDLFFSHPHASVLDLNIEGVGTDKVVIKEAQRHVVNHRLAHVDFLRISMTESVAITVPVVLQGESPAMKLGGMLIQHYSELDVEGLPGDLPEKIYVDISGLGMDENFTISELKLPEGIQTSADPDDVVCAIEAAKAASEDDEAAEATGEPEVVGKDSSGE